MHSFRRALLLLAALSSGPLACISVDSKGEAADSQAEAIEIDFNPSFILEAQDFQEILDAVDTSFKVDETFEVASDSSGGASCFLNAAEVGIGDTRIRGTMRVKQKFSLHHNLSASLVRHDSEFPGDHYRLQVAVDLGDVTADSVGELDLSTACLGLDRELSVTIHDLTVIATVAPITQQRMKFLVESVTADFGDIEVSGDSGLVNEAVLDVINAEVDKSEKTRADIKKSLERTIESSGTFEVLEDFGDFLVGAKCASARMDEGDITRVAFGKGECTSGGECAKYYAASTVSGWFGDFTL